MLQNLLSKIPFPKHLSQGLRNYGNFTKYVTSKSLNNTSIIKRFMTSTLGKRITPQKLRIKDKIPENYELVYRCTISSYLHTAQIISEFSLIGMIVLLAISYDTTNKFEFDKKTVEQFQLTNENYQLFFFLSGFVALNIAVCVFISKFPIRIYFNEANKTFLGFTLGKIPNTRKLFQFKAGELKQQRGKSSILPWNNQKYTMKNGKVIVLLEQYFRTPQYLNIMLGHVGTKMF